MSLPQSTKIQFDALDQIAPFAMVVASDGRFIHVGRSVRRVLAKSDFNNIGFFDVFSFESPRSLIGTHDLKRASGKRLSLKTERRDLGITLSLRASISHTTDKSDTFIILTSLGARMPELVEPLGLFDQDFSHADASVDLLYFLNSQKQLLVDAQALADRLEKAKNLAELQAKTDSLTGLPNRRALANFAGTMMTKWGGPRLPAYLLHVDLDRFKQVNDTLGHSAGDSILKKVARDLQAVAGPDDMIARIGGDEFVWVTLGHKTAAEIEPVATELIHRINTPLMFAGQSAQVGASVGITEIPQDCTKSMEDLLLEADLALYGVKNSERGTLKFFSREMMDREMVIQDLIRDIEPAINAGEFVPNYQIQVDVKSNQVFGAEVLGRWQHPTLGAILPKEFLYVATRTNLTEKIDLSIYLQALDDFSAWKEEGIAPPHISLNLTRALLSDPNFLGWIQDATAERKIEASEIVFELLETILLDAENADVCECANRLAKSGFKLAIDDFGTGRASLASLLSVPVEIVKIDRAFVSQIQSDSKRRLLTEAIVNVSRDLGLQVLAEGVELDAECAVLEGIGCTLFQGFHFGKPCNGLEFAEVLRDEIWRAELQNIRARNATARIA